MYILQSEELREKFDSLLWNQRKGNTHMTNGWMTEMLSELDQLAETYNWGEEERLAFASLGKIGKAVILKEWVYESMQDALHQEGYSYEVIPFPIEGQEESRP